MYESLKASSIHEHECVDYGVEARGDHFKLLMEIEERRIIEKTLNLYTAME